MAKTVYDFDKNMNNLTTEQPELKYFDAKDETKFGVYGTCCKTEEGYSRFSADQRAYVEKVSDGEAWFSRHSAGIQVKFKTDATDIYVKVRNADKFNMTNITQIGQCGVDLYVFEEKLGKFVFHLTAHGKFDDTKYDERIGDFRQLGRKTRRYIINLPLYIHTEQLEIGVNEWATVEPDVYTNPLKIAVYGSSITHGCSASRPGMAYTNILSRRLDCEFYNYGFSGVCMAEKQVATVLSQNDFDMLIIDSEPNSGVSQNLKNNLEPFLDEFLSKRKNVPVALLSRMTFTLDLFDLDRVKLNKYYVDFMRKVSASYRKKGYDVYFFDQTDVFGRDFTEYTTDGVHPTDYGMVKIADFYQKVITKLEKL